MDCWRVAEWKQAMHSFTDYDDGEFQFTDRRPERQSIRLEPFFNLFGPRQIIFSEGIGSSPMLRIKSGCVALSQSFNDGRRQIIDILGPGRIIGIPLGPLNHYTAEALARTQLENVASGPICAIEIDRELRTTLRRAQRHATLLGRKTAEERVASAILDLAQQFTHPVKSKLPRKTTFNLHLSRADLADWLGLTLETVSRHLNSFKRRKLISYKMPELVTITNEDALSALASGHGLCPNQSLLKTG